MLFSERQKLEKEYYKWLDNNKNVKPCVFNVISFLDMNGNLINKQEFNKIKILEKALELACNDIFNNTFPSLKYNNTKHNKLIKHYKIKAERLLEKK